MQKDIWNYVIFRHLKLFNSTRKFPSYISLIFQSGYSSNKKVIKLKFISDVETHRSYEYYATC